jgi:subtilisin family serine protease
MKPQRLVAYALLACCAIGSILFAGGCASTPDEPKDLACDCSVSAFIANLPPMEGRAATIGRDIILRQTPEPPPRTRLVESSRLIRATEARSAFNVSGKGLTAAILDTGIRKTHRDFSNRVLATRDFTAGAPNPAEAMDNQGHGTHVAGVVAANGRHRGIAPEASLVALKVLGDDGSGDFQWISAALQWVLDNADQLKISVVSMSLGANSNVTSDDSSSWPPLSRTIQDQIRDLTQRRIAVVIAAGNSFFEFESVQGMGFPAIIREGISVGAVYDSNVGRQSYGTGARADATGADHISPFTQRLHPCVNPQTATDIFAPGAPMTSTGILTDDGEATMSGTSQATPTVTGVVLLLQEFYQRKTGTLPTVEQLTVWLKTGGVRILDGDDEKSNVRPTGCDFYRIDAVNALTRASEG